MDQKKPDAQPTWSAEYISICHQHQVGVWRIDFLVSGYRYDAERKALLSIGKVAVEVDGHDFHEKTKEQARRDKAKDRELQRFGLTVFRFAGSEVYADPFRVAQEVIASAFGLDRKAQPNVH